MNEKETNEQVQPVFSIEKLYVKDLSLEMPNAPQIFLETAAPEIDMRVATDSKALEEGYYDCSITVTVTAKVSDKTLFLNEVTQSGVFNIANVDEESLPLLLGIACPNILFPYAREVVSSTVTRAGLPPVILAPINFEAMYHAQQAEEAKAGN